MGQNSTSTVRLKVSQDVAKVVGAGAPRDVQLAAARGALPLSGKDLLTVLFFLCSGRDAEIKRTAVATLKNLPVSILKPLLESSELHPKLLELIARLRLSDNEVIGMIVVHPGVDDATLLYLARNGSSEALEQLAGCQGKLESCPELVATILANPQAERALKFRLGWEESQEEASRKAGASESEACDEEGAKEESLGLHDDDSDDDEDDFDEIDEEIIDEDLSKYQISLNLKVAEKIKIGFTGDKEWRSLLIKDANKLVQGAVMKNPRITDGEVLLVAKNKQSSDEMIRLILLNKDWMKLYEIKKALVFHPRTPLPKALRLVGFLTLKDLKDLARSRNVQTVISSSARKEFERKQKRV
ncbi:MAG: hypothetical protein KAT93_07780 [Desulfuromonadales bacterium]|nr:hypothetical protein [Desulfuromonadales bacterium]